MLKIIETLLKKYLSLQPEKRQMSGSTSRSGNDTLTVETGVRIPYPIPGRGCLTSLGSLFLCIIM